SCGLRLCPPQYRSRPRLSSGWSCDPQILLDPRGAERGKEFAQPRPFGLSDKRLIKLGKENLWLYSVRLGEIEDSVMYRQGIHPVVEGREELYGVLAPPGEPGLVLETVVLGHEIARYPFLDVRAQVVHPFRIAGALLHLFPVPAYLVVEKDIEELRFPHQFVSGKLEGYHALALMPV